MREVSAAKASTARPSSSLTRPAPTAARSWVRTSPQDPFAIVSPRANSLRPPLSYPSAMFEGTETEERESWFRKPQSRFSPPMFEIR